MSFCGFCGLVGLFSRPRVIISLRLPVSGGGREGGVGIGVCGFVCLAFVLPT